MQTLLTLGRQPALGLAELESLFGANNLQPVGNSAVLLDVAPTDVNFHRLGGSIKAAKLLTTLDTTDWNKIERYLIQHTPEHAALLPEGKLTIGLSAIGFKLSPAKLGALGLSIKKAIRKDSGRPVRLVPNKELELNSAQVFHNHLTDDRNWELLLVTDGTKTHLAQTFAVQDIDSYTLRDRSRPKRDSRVGMLPPKLAQIIINLAKPNHGSIVLDPFCGTGVVLQEARLMGYPAAGTDLEQRMIDYTVANMQWLDEQFPGLPSFGTAKGDATMFTWHTPDFVPASAETAAERTSTLFDCVAGETYLGKPFTTTPNSATLAKTTSEVDVILKKFLRNIRTQLPRGIRLCLAVPAWQISPNLFKHLSLIDSLEEMGYNRIEFEHVRDDQLLYYREDQIVARQLLVLATR